MKTFEISKEYIMKKHRTWVHHGIKYDIYLSRDDIYPNKFYCIIYDMDDMTCDNDHMKVSSSEAVLNKFMEYTGVQIHFVD